MAAGGGAGVVVATPGGTGGAGVVAAAAGGSGVGTVGGRSSRRGGSEPAHGALELKEELLRAGRLFEDPDFPANERSLAREGTLRPGIRWRRPWEIVARPRFVIEEATRFDLDQGDLGNCWFIAAAGCLAVSNRKLFERCVPNSQSFEDSYAGIFFFRFWHFSKWVEVVVDDRLPTHRGRLIYARNRERPQEFWVALMEKAYAKLHGCYGNLSGGFMMDALVDFTGGISEYISLRKPSDVPPYLYDLMWKTARMNSMMGASIESKQRREEPLGNGLYKGHAYSITSLARLRVNTREVCLLRLRNPWGRDEWNGAWSERSREWRSISEEDKLKIGLVPREDGEFWISYEDFLDNFTDLEFCHLYPDPYTKEIALEMNKQNWEVAAHNGEWARGFNAGGCGNAPDQDLLWTNPQYMISVEEPDDEDGDGRCTVIIALMQKTIDYHMDLSISYQLFKVKGGVRPLPDGTNYDKEDIGMLISAPRYTNLRERTGRHLLPPGNYVIIPTTFLPNKEGYFMLRVFTEKKAYSSVVDVPTRPGRDLSEDNTIENLFGKHAGEDGRIYAEELREAINEMQEDDTRRIGLETSRSLLAMHDVEELGYIRLQDFRGLFKDFNLWQTAFKTFDRDTVGSIDTFEINKLFNAIGFSVSRQVQSAIVRRYGGRRRRLGLEDFVHIMCKLYAMYNQFIKRKGGEEVIVLDLEEWLSLTMFY